VTSRDDARRAAPVPTDPDRPRGAPRPPLADVGAPGAGFTRRTVWLIVGLLVFAAACSAVILLVR